MTVYLVLQAVLGTWGVIGLFAIIAFGAVYGIRKFFGKEWDAVASYIPSINFDLTPGKVILSKLVQAIPATVVAAGLGAVTSGVSLGPTLVSALAGLLAAAGHEFLKAFPLIPYKGETANLLASDPKIPGPPKLPTLLGMLAIMLSVFGCAVQPEPCTAADKAGIEARYSEKVLVECAAYSSLAECPNIDDLKAKRAKEEEVCR